ncbi:Transcription factor IIIA [Cytospora mali]|uniref:Transcription factor IIIA n=1 Tax=Cytospora mali TaxID=578113 RepID=A0A194VNJ0_CYTMA|nr:Transcription factor IIIA [Valsa mali]
MKRKAEDDGPEGGVKKQLMDISQGFSTEESASVTGSDDVTTLPPAPADHPTPPTAPSITSKASKKRNYPSEQKIITCTVADCPKTFNRPARLLAHLRSHNNERPYLCTFDGCGKSYTENKHLKQHLLSHTKEAKYVCDTCDKGFSTGTRLRRHQKVHEGEERFRCREYPPCNQSFRKHQTLQRHILKEHMGKKPFPCVHVGCEASYDTANALAAHKERDHGELRFWCDECCEAAAARRSPDGEPKKPVGFTTQFLLDQHIRHEHVNCIFCDVRFTGQYELDQHMEIYHSGLTLEDRKTVVCKHPGCGKKFTKKSNMTAHHRTAHEGMRFVCGKVDTSDAAGGLERWDWAGEGCGEGFVDKAKLVQHVLFVHLGRPRPESGPGATYPQSKQPPARLNFLNEISGVADQERRQAVCTVPACGARFIRYADLHNHTQRDHPEHAGEVGLLGASGVPQPPYGEVAGPPDSSAALPDGQQQPFDVTLEEAKMMQLVDWDAVIDPNLLL